MNKGNQNPETLLTKASSEIFIEDFRRRNGIITVEYAYSKKENCDSIEVQEAEFTEWLTEKYPDIDHEAYWIFEDINVKYNHLKEFLFSENTKHTTSKTASQLIELAQSNEDLANLAYREISRLICDSGMNTADGYKLLELITNYGHAKSLAAAELYDQPDLGIDNLLNVIQKEAKLAV